MTTLNDIPRRSNRRGLDLRNGLRYPEWRSYSRKKCEEKGWWPNRVYWNKETEVVIVCQRSGPDKNWSLSATATRDALEGETQRRVVQAYVLLLDTDGSYVTHETVQNVMRSIGRTEPNRGRYGDYWWLNANMATQEPSNPDDASGPLG